MQNSIQNTIIERTSRRSYEPRDFSAEMIGAIGAILKSAVIGPLGTKTEFELIRKNSEENKKLKLGTYGFISGSSYFIVGQTQAGKNASLDYAYLLEKIILELTRLNLGTCWLGGTFDRGEFAKTINLKPGNIIPAITPVGYYTANRSLGEKVIRFGAGSTKRKEWESIFFNETPERPVIRENIDKAVSSILEMVRLAPSASNIQPWRIVLKNTHEFHFYLQRKPGYGKAFGKVDLQMIDMGIAMCHFDLTAVELDKKPDWQILVNPQKFINWEYIITAII